MEGFAYYPEPYDHCQIRNTAKPDLAMNMTNSKP